ncbi:MAG: hypothetical protein QNJ37_11210 [Crocosphaera sp.]|nr:hypothetical protein [Crocosphaera sp.]
MNKKLFSIILIGILILGCHPLTNLSNSQPITVNLGEPFNLKINQEALIVSEDINIKFLTVKEDSRCPLNMQCVWPGQVKIVVKIIHKNQDLGDFNLISRVGENPVKTFKNYGVELMEVTPLPKNNETVEMSDYQAILVVNESTL